MNNNKIKLRKLLLKRLIEILNLSKTWICSKNKTKINFAVNYIDSELFWYKSG